MSGRWHIPSDTEWVQLLDLLGGEAVAGGPKKQERNIGKSQIQEQQTRQVLLQFREVSIMDMETLLCLDTIMVGGVRRRLMKCARSVVECTLMTVK